jgi:hypothetical protein
MFTGKVTCCGEHEHDLYSVENKPKLGRRIRLHLQGEEQDQQETNEQRPTPASLTLVSNSYWLLGWLILYP